MARKAQQPTAGYELNVEKQEVTDVWNAQRVEAAYKAIDDGVKLKNTPFYNNNTNLRKANLVYDYNKWELDEITKCKQDICYFADNYCKVMTDDGIMKIKLRPYQRAMLKHYQANRFSICLASRQIGKTICSSIFIAWYSLFNFDRNVMILSNKGDTTKEIIDKGKVIFENLPFFLKPGILKWDVMSEKFDNGCRVVGQNTTKRSGISFTIHLLFLDEFAHIDPGYINPFYENIYPTLSSSKVSRIIITSTPNGFNKMYDLYTAAENGENSYAPFRVDWWEVPGRDDNWYRQEVKNLGGIPEFNRQYGNSFLDEGEILLTSDTLRFMQNAKQKFIHHDFVDLDDYDIDYRDLTWDPRFDVDTIQDENRYYLFSVDISEGNGGRDGAEPDYSVINIFKLQPVPLKYMESLNGYSIYDFFGLRQIGRYHNNKCSVEELSKILYILMFKIFDPEKVKCIIEWNIFGGELLRNLMTVFPRENDFDESIILRFRHNINDNKLKPGLRLKGDNKTIYCQNMKSLASKHRIELIDNDTVLEAKTFGKVKNSFAAQVGHDDLMMSSINATAFFETVEYNDFVEEYYDMIKHETKLKIDECLGKYSNGEDLTDANDYNIYETLM